MEDKIEEEKIIDNSEQEKIEESCDFPAYCSEIISIKGMHCKSCVELIEMKLKDLAGVKVAKTCLMENKVYVEFDPEQTDLNEINKEIERAGYKVNNKGAAHRLDNIKSSVKSEETKKSIWQGIGYGLIPHIGCIAFIIGSVLGVTLLMNFFKPLLLNRYFFHILILISLMFATLSSALYLRRNGLLSMAGAKKKWKYLFGMYGSTLGINLILFFLIFPLVANISTVSASSVPLAGAIAEVGNNQDNYLGSQDSGTLKIRVNIPCPGHAPLITNELRSIKGVLNTEFSFPNVFDIRYDASKTSTQEILALDVFKTYKATVVNE